MTIYSAVERDLAHRNRRRLPTDPEAELRSRMLIMAFLGTLRAIIQYWVELPS